MNSAIELIRSAVAQSDNLTDIDAVVAEHPAFYVGRAAEIVRQSVQPGRVVKLMACGASEVFHVEVLDCTVKGVFFGRIDNDLQRTDLHGLRDGDVVLFEARHIREVKPMAGVTDPSIWNKPLVMQVDAGRSVFDASDEPLPEPKPPEYVDDLGGDYMTLAEFLEGVECSGFTDYDGYGYAVTRGDVACTSIQINPSAAARIPEGTTHIIWFNK